MEVGKAACCAEVEFSSVLVAGNSTLLGGSIAAEVESTAEVGDSNTLVRGSNTLVGCSMAGMEGSNTLVAGSTASALDDTFWYGCALQRKRH